MKSISHFRLAVVFAGLWWAATMACAVPAQTPTFFFMADAATPQQNGAQTAQKTAKKEPGKSGELHHFGE